MATLMGDGSLLGASVGDSELWCRSEGEWIELTEHQAHKPLVGSGRATPVPFGTGRVEKLILGSDGLFKYAPHKQILDLLDADDPELGWKLVDAVRLPNGGLRDDVSFVVARRSGAAGQG